jgi:hypothetical protein
MNEFRTRSSLLSIVEGAAWLISARQKSPEIETLLAASSGAAELLGPGRNDIGSALAVLLRAFTEEAALSAFGWLAARWDIEKHLANLCRFRDEEMRFLRSRKSRLRAGRHYWIAAQWDDISPESSGGGPRKSDASVLAGFRSLPPSASIRLARPKATSRGSTAALFQPSRA